MLYLVAFIWCHSVYRTEAVVAKQLDDYKILYVISENGNCSSLQIDVIQKKWPCHPLSFYVKNVNEYFVNNTQVLFTAGTHLLPLPSDNETQVINVTGITNFSMIGLGEVEISEEEGAPLPTSIISCNVTQDNNDQVRNGILFYKSSGIHIENLTIEKCGAKFAVRGPDNFTLVSALTFRESYSIILTQVRIDKSLGFGLDADRIFGSFQVSRSIFVRSKSFKLKPQKDIGGNARFWYSKYNSSLLDHNVLNISQSWFMCGHLNSDKDYRGFNFASGLIIRIYIPSVSVNISHITVKENVGTHGGNLAILVTDFHENTSSIAISNSVIANGTAIRGGGLQFWVQVDNKHNFYSLNSSKLIHHRIMEIRDTNFTNNTAGESGGGIYIGHYESNTIDNIIRHISFKGCKFSDNSVHYSKGLTRSYSGAAIEVIRHSINDFTSHTTPQYSIDFEGCQFKQNKLSEVTNEGGILDFVATQTVTITNCTFSFNVGTAISLRQSNIRFYKYNIFERNTARHGGALKFCELSKMYLPINGSVHIDFIENLANISGGAIYISQQLCLETAPPCFFQPLYVKHGNSSVNDLHMRLNFVNNTAKFAGDVIYGGQVDHCYLYYSHYDNHSTYLSHRVFNCIFDLTEQRKSLSRISSAPYGACLYNSSDNKLNCSHSYYPSIVYPGQSIVLNVSAVGQRNGTSPVRSNLFQFQQICDSHSGCYSHIEIKTAANSQNDIMPYYVSLNCTVYSNQSNATFNLTIQQASQAEMRYVHYKSPRLKFKIGECPWGFIASRDLQDRHKCTCDSLLSNYSIRCDIDRQQVTRWGFYWLGCANFHQHSETTNSGENCKGVVLAFRCIYDYCVMEYRQVSSTTLNNQCSEGREGILCGRCMSNYSLSLGTSRCLRSCPTYMAYIVVLVSATSGILLILFLITCNFTVSEGTINGFLFYAHIMHKKANLFFPRSTGESNTNIFRLFIAWLNLDAGFDVCFFKSMTQYQKIWLQFGFLFYILLLKFLIVILSRRYIFFTRLVGRNVVKVLATLGLVFFPLMFNTALGCLQFLYVWHSDNHTTVIWQLDGNLKYLSGKHIPLFMLGAALCLITLLATLALLFIQCLQKNTGFICIAWVDRLRPFFDAYTGPCHVHYRFWPGFLFFARLTLFVLNTLVIDKNNFNLYIIIAACVLILIIALVLPNGVYNRWTLNVLESTFFINLGMVCGLVAIFSPDIKYTSDTTTPYIVYPSVALTMALFVGILIYHCRKQLQSYRCCRQLTLLAIKNRLKFNKERIGFKRQRQMIKDEEEEREPFLHIHQNMAHVVHYREELIED